MNKSLNASPLALREAFYALSTAREFPDASMLDDVIRRYPEFGRELTEFAIAIAIDALSGDRIVEAAEVASNPSIVSSAVSRAMSHFQNRLHAVNMGTAAAGKTGAIAEEVANPFLGVSRSEFRAVAVRLNANAVFVSKLRDRLIDPATMTPGFRRRVADELKAPLDLVVAHFVARQSVPTGQFFKADGKPSTGVQQTFEEAVRSSGLSEGQQLFLLGL